MSQARAYRVWRTRQARVQRPSVRLRSFTNLGDGRFDIDGRLAYAAWLLPYRHWHQVSPEPNRRAEISCDYHMPTPVLDGYVLHEGADCGATAYACGACDANECCFEHGKGALIEAHERWLSARMSDTVALGDVQGDFDH